MQLAITEQVPSSAPAMVQTQLSTKLLKVMKEKNATRPQAIPTVRGMALVTPTMAA